MTTNPPPTYQATVAYVDSRSRRLDRLVIVIDPDLGAVPVWWHLSRPRMWRCTAHGRTDRPECAHVAAAARALATELLGVQP